MWSRRAASDSVCSFENVVKVHAREVVSEEGLVGGEWRESRDPSTKGRTHAKEEISAAS